VPFPEEATRNYIVTILVMDLVATYCWDLLMKFTFARHILIASFKETTWSDIFKLARTAAVISFLMYSVLGSDDTWEEMERMMAELEGTDAENATDGDVAAESIAGTIKDAAEFVIENVSAAIHDEF